MIYFDNGATTYPKPRCVVNAVTTAMNSFGANPGRGGHSLAMSASELLYSARDTTARFFGCGDPSRVIFTLNCTVALNIVIKGVLKEGDHVVISSYEHNAVLRPLEKLKEERGVTYSVAQVYEGDDDRTVDSFREAFRGNTRLCVFTCASNVFGIRLPIERLSFLCHEYGILSCVDAAQGAGLIPMDLSRFPVDFLCAAGHKGLYGPMGTGFLIINSDTIPDSLIEGGTGSNSSQMKQPDILPDKFESGTPNLPGLAGLKSGIEFVSQKGAENIARREMIQLRKIYNVLEKNNNVILYTMEPDLSAFVPVLSFNVRDKDSEDVAELLNRRYNIGVRAGLHCAPLAHKTKGTLSTGAVRIVPSAFTTENDIHRLNSALINLK